MKLDPVAYLCIGIRSLEDEIARHPPARRRPWRALDCWIQVVVHSNQLDSF